MRGNYTAQINWSHTETGDWRWNMPGQWFESPSFGVGGTDSTVRLVVMQTTTTSIVRNVSLEWAAKEEHAVYDQVSTASV